MQSLWSLSCSILLLVWGPVLEESRQSHEPTGLPCSSPFRCSSCRPSHEPAVGRGQNFYFSRLRLTFLDQLPFFSHHPLPVLGSSYTSLFLPFPPMKMLISWKCLVCSTRLDSGAHLWSASVSSILWVFGSATEGWFLQVIWRDWKTMPPPTTTCSSCVEFQFLMILSSNSSTVPSYMVLQRPPRTNTIQPSTRIPEPADNW